MSMVHEERAVGERVGEEMVKAEVGEEKGREVGEEMVKVEVEEERGKEVGERVGEEMVKVEVGEEMVKVEVEDTHQVHALQSMKPRLWRWPLPLQ